MDGILLETWNELWPQIYATVIQPALVALGVYLAAVFKNATDKVSTTICDSQEKASLQSITSIQANIMMELRHVVESAVAASMEMANELKARNNGELTADQITDLRTATKSIINMSLPNDLTDDGGAMKELMGGEAALSRIIDSMIEQYVIEVKSKMATCNSNETIVG